MTSEEEINRLTSKLDTAKEKFIKEWTGESYEKARQRIKDGHLNALKGGKGSTGRTETLQCFSCQYEFFTTVSFY